MNDNKSTNYNCRFLAHIVVEAITPLAIGSGEKSIYSDALIATDINGLPYIPGTSIAGVLRSMVSPEDTRELFGFQTEDGNGLGSRIVFSDAKLLNSKGKASDGILNAKDKDDSLLKCYSELPIRQHVRISSKGVAEHAGKFDEQVIFAGSRFCFDVEAICSEQDEKHLKSILHKINSISFRLGGGTRTGFGNVKTVEIKSCVLNLSEPNDLKKYLAKTSDLNDSFWETILSNDNKTCENNETSDRNWIKYKLSLQPANFFSIGSGFADDEVDMTPVKEEKVVWNNGCGKMTDKLVLIPASSLKGALAHRTAYHWNLLKKQYASEESTCVGNDNKAVKLLFGYQNQISKEQRRGCVLFDDIIGQSCNDVVLNHVRIDRFTGGASKGALFNEKVLNAIGKQYVTEILVAKPVSVTDKDYNPSDYETAIQAFESALTDLVSGKLPIGSGSSRGNGIFSGKFIKEM